MSAVRSQPVYLVKGDDAALVAQEVRVLLDDVVGDGDHALIVEEVGGGPGDELSVGAVVDACLTPPFLVDRRVVVVREAGRLLTADAPRLVEVVQDPLPSTVLILVGGGGTIPAPLVKAISAAGQVIDVTTSKAGDRKAWLHDHLRHAPVSLEPQAAQRLGGFLVAGGQGCGVRFHVVAQIFQREWRCGLAPGARRNGPGHNLRLGENRLRAKGQRVDHLRFHFAGAPFF